MSNVKGSKKGVYGIKIDKEQFERLCSIMCSVDEICGFFGVSYDTLKRFCKQNYNQNFEAVQKDKSALGKISLRRIQFKQAERYPAMAIFLGKQYLGQTDNAHLDNLSDELSKRAETIVVKIRDKAYDESGD
jgi:hypothetical protein